VVVWLDSNGEQVSPAAALAPDSPGAAGGAGAPDPCCGAGRIHAGHRPGRRPDDGDVLGSGGPFGRRATRRQSRTGRSRSGIPATSRGAVRLCGDRRRRATTVSHGAHRRADAASRYCSARVCCTGHKPSSSSARTSRTSRARLIVPDCGSLLPMTRHGSRRDCVGHSGCQSRNTCPWEDAR